MHLLRSRIVKHRRAHREGPRERVIATVTHFRSSSLLVHRVSSRCFVYSHNLRFFFFYLFSSLASFTHIGTLLIFLCCLVIAPAFFTIVFIITVRNAVTRVTCVMPDFFALINRQQKILARKKKMGFKVLSSVPFRDNIGDVLIGYTCLGTKRGHSTWKNTETYPLRQQSGHIQLHIAWNNTWDTCPGTILGIHIR